MGKKLLSAYKAFVKALKTPDRDPEGSKGDSIGSFLVDPVADLVEEILGEPELAEDESARQRAEARLDEAELVEEIRLEQKLGFRVDGVAYRRLFDDLWLYAWPVMKALIRTNRMGQVLHRYGVHRSFAITPEDQVVLRASEAERDALAFDVIAAAVKHFRTHAVLQGKWSPQGGASLRTWFIGTCALNFPRAYARWSAGRTERLGRLAQSHEIDLNEVGGRVATQVPDPAEIAADRDDLREMIDLAQPMTRIILGMIMEGLTHAQIAAELGLTVKAVEGRIYRLRQRVLQRQRRQRPFRWASQHMPNPTYDDREPE